MQRDYWHKQSSSEPLFPDLLWSRPENKTHAGKLLVVGGNAMAFASPAEAYQEAVKAGAGTVRVLLPSSLQKTVGRVFEAGEYAPSTPSGSFSQQALSELQDMAAWADAVLLAGDFGRNSETAVLLEKFIEKYNDQVSLCCDAVDYFLQNPLPVLDRDNTSLIVDMTQLQKLTVGAKFPTAFTSNMDFLHVIDTLHEFSREHQANIVLIHEKSIFIAAEGEVSTTQFEALPSFTKVAAHASVWWLQNQSETFKALTTAILETK